MRLSRLAIACVCLCVVWALVTAKQTHDGGIERAQSFASLAYKNCAFAKKLSHSPDLTSCESERAANVATWMKDDWQNIAFAALAPLPLIWIGVYSLVFAARAQAAGFKATVPWKALSAWGKGFVAICVLTACAALYFAGLLMLDLYLDSKVPVALSPFFEVMPTGAEFVQVKGTWTRRGAAVGSEMAYPLQTSTIECDKSANECVEARASVSGTLLAADLIRYQVRKWGADGIVMASDGLCADEIYTIDLNTRAVSGAGRRNSNGAPLCEDGLGADAQWSYRMESGFPIYWQERDKARPALLRVMQGVFGH